MTIKSKTQKDIREEYTQYIEGRKNANKSIKIIFSLIILVSGVYNKITEGGIDSMFIIFCILIFLLYTMMTDMHFDFITDTIKVRIAFGRDLPKDYLQYLGTTPDDLDDYVLHQSRTQNMSDKEISQLHDLIKYQDMM